MSFVKHTAILQQKPGARPGKDGRRVMKLHRSIELALGDSERAFLGCLIRSGSFPPCSPDALTVRLKIDMIVAGRILHDFRIGSVNILSLSRSEEHRLNSSHSQISYAVFCLKKKI